MAFFRLVYYLEHQELWVCLQTQNGQKEKNLMLKNFLYFTVRNYLTMLKTSPIIEQHKLVQKNEWEAPGKISK